MDCGPYWRDHFFLSFDMQLNIYLNLYKYENNCVYETNYILHAYYIPQLWGRLPTIVDDYRALFWLIIGNHD